MFMSVFQSKFLTPKCVRECENLKAVKNLSIYNAFGKVVLFICNDNTPNLLVPQKTTITSHSFEYPLS